MQMTQQYISPDSLFILCIVKEAGYEVREFPARRWVSTDSVADNPHDGPESGETFDLLFQYIAGNNAEGVEIDMTAPVTRLITPSPVPMEPKAFTESFYIPAIYQENPVQPIDPLVYIEDRATFQVTIWLSKN